MNIGKIAQDNMLQVEEPQDMKPWYRQQETEITAIVEALGHINSSNYWKVLKDKVFDGALDVLQRKLEDEKEDKELYRLQGRIVERKSLDLDKLLVLYKNQLLEIRSKLK